MIDIWIEGKPATQGSKRIMPHASKMRKDGVLAYFHGEEWIPIKKITKYTFILEANKDNDGWRKHVQEAFKLMCAGVEMMDEPVVMVVTFYRERPKTHLTSKGQLSADGKRNPYPATRPDSIKLTRSVEDALSGYAWKDDALIVDHVIRKRYGDSEGVHIMAWPKRDCPVEVLINE